jgi:hypothetical protein
MLRRVLWFAVTLPAAVVCVTLAVVNGHPVRLVLDPFRPDRPVLSLVLPFYVYLLAALLFGILIGGASVWRAQARWRRAARRRAGEAQRWRAEAERLQQVQPEASRPRLAARQH